MLLKPHKNGVKYHQNSIGAIRCTNMEKIASMQALLVDNFWENFGHLLDKQQSLVVHTHQVHKFSCQSTINLFLLENITYIEENYSFGNFSLLTKYFYVCGQFPVLKILLADKNQLFPCL